MYIADKICSRSNVVFVVNNAWQTTEHLTHKQNKTPLFYAVSKVLHFFVETFLNTLRIDGLDPSTSYCAFHGALRSFKNLVRTSVYFFLKPFICFCKIIIKSFGFFVKLDSCTESACEKPILRVFVRHAMREWLSDNKTLRTTIKLNWFMLYHIFF